MEEMAKSHTAETTALCEELKGEMERKLVEQKKDMKVMRSILKTEHGSHSNCL